MLTAMIIAVAIAMVTSINYNCLDNNHSAIPIRDENCRDVYQCVHGNLTHYRTCEENEIWSNMANWCVEKGSMYDDCNVGLPPFIRVVNDSRCQANPWGNNPDAEFCDMFISCWNYTSVDRRSCTSKTRFSIETYRCEHKVNVYCGNRGRDFSTSSSSDDRDSVCRGRADVTVNPSNCAQFYQCPMETRLQCAWGTYFSQEKKMCIYRHDLSSDDLKLCQMANNS